MHFTEGQTVVHPHHGPATVRSIVPRRLKDQDCTYLVLDVHSQSLTVGVPLQNADLVGLREVLGGGRLRALFETLSGPAGSEERQWSRRFKDNREKLSTGNPLRIAEVVRDLMRRRARTGLSPAEAAMLKHAIKPLATEIGLALAVTAEEAERMIEASQSTGWAPRPES